MTTAVDEKVLKLKADEALAAKQGRAEKAATLRQRAEALVAAEQRAADEAARRKKADEVERELRSHSTPRVTITTDSGQEVVIELGASEQVARGTQTEAVRRLCLRAAEAFRSRVVASRAAGEVVPPVRFLEPMLDNSSDLLQANRLGLVVVRDAR